MTVFDKYSLACMFVLITFGIWHSIAGSLIFYLNNFDKITPTNYWLWVDRYVLIALGSIFIIGHVLFIVWYFRIPLRKRHQMRRKDNEYRKLLAQKMSSSIKQQMITDGRATMLQKCVRQSVLPLSLWCFIKSALDILINNSVHEIRALVNIFCFFDYIIFVLSLMFLKPVGLEELSC